MGDGECELSGGTGLNMSCETWSHGENVGEWARLQNPMQCNTRSRGLGFLARSSRCLSISDKCPESAGGYLIGYRPIETAFLQAGSADDRR